MQRPRGDDLDSLIVLSLRDWLDLHGPVRNVGEPAAITEFELQHQEPV